MEEVESKNQNLETLRDLLERLREVDEMATITDADVTPLAGLYPSREIVQEIVELFSKVLDFSRICDLGKTNSACFGGVAISPYGAYKCAFDSVRTTKFVLGLIDAIKVAQKKFPGQKIRVAEVGSGPLAILSVCAASQFSPDQVEFSLLDLHRQSLDLAKIIIENFGMEDSFKNFICADATNYNFKESEKPHVSVAEVMNASLSNEPQLAVSRNVVPQIVEGGIFLPEKVDLYASVGLCMERQRLGSVLEITQETVSAALETLGKVDDAGAVSICRTFPYPKGFGESVGDSEGYDYYFVLSTEVTVFRDYKIAPQESQITRDNYQFPGFSKAIAQNLESVNIYCTIGSREDAGEYGYEFNMGRGKRIKWA